MTKRHLVYMIAAVGMLGLSQRAHASLPVPFEVVGCVTGGEFISEGHTFPVRPEDGKADLVANEGKTIEVTGFLSPGDRLSVGKVRIVAADCQRQLHRSKFLCDPCITR